MCAVKDDQSVVIDRESDQDKSHDPSGPASGARSAAGRPQRRPLVLHLRQRVEHIRHGRHVPSVPSPVDFDPVPIVWPLVAAFGLVAGNLC